jgi:DNA primase
VVTLRRRGRSAIGLCPSHGEKTPSFTVSEERGFFHCFGCGEHGDVFAFVMKTQSLAFPEAVRLVADRFGIAVPEDRGGGPRRETEPLAAVNAAAAAFFGEQLAGAPGARARAYLRERGLSDEVVRRFGLGWAPGAGDVLARHLRTRGLPLESALAAGLVFRAERADTRLGLIDRFRDRVMFPIRDRFGKVIAFGGRVLPGHAASGDPPPKYLNSPDSPLFRKGHTLYGLAEAREAIRRTGRAIVVEGYLDVIALADAGVGAAVAPLGTALTGDQLRVLRRLTDVVVACFDGDAAGRRAAARSFPVFLEAGFWGRGAFLPAGDDPDSFVRAHGREAFEAVVAGAEPLIEAYLTEIGDPERRAVRRNAEAAREIARILRGVRSPIEFGLLAQLAAERLGVREEVLRAEGTAESAPPPPVPVATADAPRSPEELLVELMAADPAVARRIGAEDVIQAFEHPTWRRAAEMLVEGRESERTAAVQGLPRGVRDRVARRLLGDIEGEDRERAVADCVARIRARRQRQAKSVLLEEIRAAQSRGDAAAVEAAMQRLKNLMDSDHTEKVRTS